MPLGRQVKKGGAKSPWSLAGSYLVTAGNSHLSQILRGAADWVGHEVSVHGTPQSGQHHLLSSQGRGMRHLGLGRVLRPRGGLRANVHVTLSQ